MSSAGGNGIRLGVNVDHAATLRNARGGVYPDPLEVALAAARGGADRVTAHLREDRRHIKDADLFRLKGEAGLPLNFEMAPTEEMLQIALQLLPATALFVPEKREELTTEGGLDARAHEARLAQMTAALGEKGVAVSFFVDPEMGQIEAAARAGADAVELHTGDFCLASSGGEKRRHADRLREGAALAHELGMEAHAGHGLDYETASLVASMPHICELNIGHFLMGAALLLGTEEATQRMVTAIREGALARGRR